MTQQWRQRRIRAGFGLSAAAKLLQLLPSELADMEHGRREFWPELLDRMTVIYGEAANAAKGVGDA